MKVSVVLTTYNGRKYLIPLLDSLRDQTRKIDEVLICDDGSTDGTRDLVVEYIKNNQLSNWKKCWNTENYGWMKNFRVGIQNSVGDIVFPCDQDDIWELDKIEQMASIMESNDKIWLLSSDYKPLYENGGHKVDEFKTYDSDKLVKVKCDERFALHERPGCVMAISRKLIEKTEGIWLDWYPHDAFVWTVANLNQGCYLLHKPLIRYRRHDANASTGSQHIANAQVKSMKRTSNLVNWYLKSESNCEKDMEKILSNYLKFAKLRIELILNKKIGNWFKLWRYKKYYRSSRQMLGDWYYIFKAKGDKA